MLFKELLGVCSIRVLAKIMAIPIMNPLSWFMIRCDGMFVFNYQKCMQKREEVIKSKETSLVIRYSSSYFVSEIIE